MRIAGLRNLQFCYNYNVSDKIAPFMQRTLANEVASLRYNVKYLFDVLKVQNHVIEPEVLRKCGILEMGKSAEEGIRLVGDEYNHVIAFPSPEVLRLAYLNKINGDAERIVTIDNGNFYNLSKNRTEENFADCLDETLNLIEGNILDFKSRFSAQPSRPYIPTSTEKKALDDINRTLRLSKIHPAVTDFVRLSENEHEVAGSILERYQSIKNLEKNFNNSTTQHNVRGYYKNYDASNSNANMMSFKNISSDGEIVGVGTFVHKGDKYLMIKVMPKEEVPYAFVISKDGTVQKNLPYETVRTPMSKKRHDAIPQYYAQHELDKLNIKKYLEIADSELENFERHITDCQARQVEFLTEHNNDSVGSLVEQMPKINGIYKAIEKLKADIKNRFEFLTNSTELFSENNIDIEFSRRGVKLGKVTPEKEDLRITFPSVSGQRASQILVMDGDNIKKSFYIIDEKLLKLDIKKLSDAFTHATRQRYYHSQDYIDNSGLNKYIDLTLKTLRRASNVIKKENNF